MQPYQQEGYQFGQRTGQGSNSYANGANQNCGNVITDRPTSRVLAPPGGGSSFSIGWDTSDNPHRKENRNMNPPPNSFAVSDYQNSNTRYGKSGGRNESSINLADHNPNKQQIEPYQKPRVQHSQQHSQIFEEQKQPYQQQQQYPPSQYQQPPQQQYQPPPQQYQPPQQQYQQPPQQQYQQPPQQQYQQPPQQQYQPPQQQQHYQQPPQQTTQYGGTEPTFGARLDRGSNSFANGANQNCGNYLTDRPTSRVLAPPGGKSNFTLG